MILWTIQPEKVFREIQRKGVYHCDIDKSGMKEFSITQYDWLVSQMKKRIGPPPDGVSYPVWAWKRFLTLRLLKMIGRVDVNLFRQLFGNLRKNRYEELRCLS